MSATIYWRPVAYSHKPVPVGAPSSFIAAMEATFGSPPWILGSEHDEQLKAMEAVYKPNQPNPYTYLRHQLFNSDGEPTSIEVWPSY